MKKDFKRKRFYFYMRPYDWFRAGSALIMVSVVVLGAFKCYDAAAEWSNNKKMEEVSSEAVKPK